MKLLVRPIDPATLQQDWNRDAVIEILDGNVGIQSRDAELRETLQNAVASLDSVEVIERTLKDSGPFAIFPLSRFQLRQQAGPDAPRVFPLDTERVTVGRSPQVTIPVMERAMARTHFALNWSPRLGTFTVEEYGHPNEVHLNHLPCEMQVNYPLQPGDVLSLGDTSLIFERSDGRQLGPSPTNAAPQRFIRGSARELDAPVPLRITDAIVANATDPAWGTEPALVIRGLTDRITRQSGGFSIQVGGERVELIGVKIEETLKVIRVAYRGRDLSREEYEIVTHGSFALFRSGRNRELRLREMADEITLRALELAEARRQQFSSL